MQVEPEISLAHFRPLLLVFINGLRAKERFADSKRSQMEDDGDEIESFEKPK